MTYPDMARFLALTPIQPPHKRQPKPRSTEPPLSVSTPTPLLNALQAVGLKKGEGEWLIKKLEASSDHPYHAGRLLNGKIYVVSQNDQVFYGHPGQLKALAVFNAYRTKCADQQKRYLETENGLRITIQAQNGHKTAQVKHLLWGTLPLPLPHTRQIGIYA